MSVMNFYGIMAVLEVKYLYSSKISSNYVSFTLPYSSTACG